MRDVVKRSAMTACRHSIAAFTFGALAGGAGDALAQSDAVAAGAALPQVVTSYPATKPTAAQINAFMTDLQQRALLIDQLAKRFQAEAAAQSAGSFNAIDWKLDFGSRLMHQPVAKLQQALTAPTLSMARNELFNSRAAITQKHNAETEQSVNMITPCRIVDTRSGGGGQLGPAARYWAASDTPATIAAQGGNAAGCGSFPNANGWLLYVTVVPPAGNTSPNFLTVQHDAGVPTTATMNWVNQNIANFAIPLCQGCIGGPGGFYAYASANTHVVVDLIGYIQGESAAALQCVNQTGSTAIASPSSGEFCTPACGAGYTLVGGGCDWGSFGGFQKSITETGGNRLANAWCCGGLNNSGATRTLMGTAYCCRTPGKP